MLNKLVLKNYRNLSIELSLAKLNLINEPNGSGKSNILESIYYSNTAKSFRPLSGFSDIIQNNSEFAKGELYWDSSRTSFTISNSKKLNRYFFEYDSKQKMSDIIGRRNILLFAPSTLNIVDGEPSVRRADLDDYLSIVSSEYKEALLSYQKVIKNRNITLKLINDGKNLNRELDLFTAKLVDNAVTIFEYRFNFFHDIESYVSKVSDDLYRQNEDDMKIVYNPSIENADLATYRETLIAKFEENREKEIVVTKTLYGPHKDDYFFMYGNHNLRYYGSRGQQRLSGLIFKLSQLKYLNSINQKESILLLDDLMSELDSSHRENCSNYIIDGDFQTILTTSVSDDIPSRYYEKSNILSIN